MWHKAWCLLKTKVHAYGHPNRGFSNVVKGTCAISFFSSVLCFRIPLRATKACPGIRLVRQWDGHVVVTLRSGKGHYSRTQTMCRLVRLARSPCRLGPWCRKSVNLKNVSFYGQTCGCTLGRATGHGNTWHATGTSRSFGPRVGLSLFMSRLVRLARSPCRLGTWFRKSVSLKNVSFNGQTTANDLPLSALRASSRRPLRGL